jgi:hypothetical protein
MRSYLPDVAGWIFHHRATIAVRHILRFFERYGSGTESSMIGSVDIVDIQVKKGRH